MDANETKKYLKYLGPLLEGYDNAVHYSIGTTPNIACNNKFTYPRIREKLKKYYNNFTKIKAKLVIGDIVRIKHLTKSSFHKGYKIRNNQELFQINEVVTNLPIPMYQVQSRENLKEEVIEGHFYGPELTLVSQTHRFLRLHEM